MTEQIKGHVFTRGRYTVNYKLSGDTLTVEVFDGSHLQHRFKVQFPWDCLTDEQSRKRHQRNGDYRVSAHRDEKKRELMFWVIGPDNIHHFVEGVQY